MAPLSTAVQIASSVVLLQCVVALSPSLMSERIPVDGCDVLLGSHILNSVQLILSGCGEISLEVNARMSCFVGRQLMYPYTFFFRSLPYFIAL